MQVHLLCMYFESEKNYKGHEQFESTLCKVKVKADQDIRNHMIRHTLLYLYENVWNALVSKRSPEVKEKNVLISPLASYFLKIYHKTTFNL